MNEAPISQVGLSAVQQIGPAPLFDFDRNGGTIQVKPGFTKVTLPLPIQAVAGTDGTAYVLPAGTSFFYFILRVVTATGAVDSQASGIATGGTTVGASASSHTWKGFILQLVP